MVHLGDHDFFGMTDVHGELLELEKIQLEKIAETLSVPADIEDLTGKMNKGQSDE